MGMSFGFCKKFISIILKYVKPIDEYLEICTQYKFVSVNKITECAR